MPVKKRPPKILPPVEKSNLDPVKVRAAILQVMAAREVRDRRAARPARIR